METKSFNNKIALFAKFSTLFFLLSCSKGRYEPEMRQMNEKNTISSNINEAKGSKETTNPFLYNRKIIKSASTRYKVKDIKIAIKKIKSISYNYKSYISNLKFENNLHKKESKFTIQVPSHFFDNIMDSIHTVAEFIDFENISTNDVTEEYIDLQARLKTKIEVKGRYETILRKNSKTIEDILMVENKLRAIQEEIESAKGRLKYLTEKVSFSSININLYETVAYKQEPSVYEKTFFSKTKSSISNGLYVVEIIILGIMNIWPLLIIGVASYLFYKKRKANK